MFPDESWLGDRTLPPSTVHREAFLRANCDYWLVEDIVDWYLKGIAPRRVMAIRCKPARTDDGHIRTFVSAAKGGVASRVDALVPAVQRCVSKKHQQLQGAPDLRWLVVVLDDGLAEMQLQRAFPEDSPFESDADSADDLGHLAQLGDIVFPGIDEVWGVGPSRLGEHLGRLPHGAAYGRNRLQLDPHTLQVGRRVGHQLVCVLDLPGSPTPRGIETSASQNS